MATLYHKMMTFFQTLSAFRNIARNNLDGTVRSSGLRGTDVIVNLSFDRFKFWFYLQMHIQYICSDAYKNYKLALSQ
jgi:hypothetical protein